MPANTNQPRERNGRFARSLPHGNAPTSSPDIPQLPPGPEQQSQSAPWSERYHLHFSSFHRQTIRETKALFRSRPSQLTPPQRQKVFSQWIEAVSHAYRMDPPAVYWDEEADYAGGGFYRPSDHSITLSPNRPSITTLLHEFRHALQAKECGAPTVSEDIEIDARAWSLSLYYQCRPVLFMRLVREGRILHVSENL